MSGPEVASGARAASSERRPVTVLFCDLVGSTAIVEKMDPEDWTTIVGKAFARMNSTVSRYDGTIARLMGDGLLAFFGAPVAHEDDPERAVRCGLELVRAIEALGTELAMELHIRVGINSGPVVVATVGTDAKSEYTAMGDTVNVAARMQAAAQPDTVLVTAATHRFIAPLVDAIDRGLLELKGKSEQVRAYEITALRSGARSARGIAGVRAPMVGRDAQLAALERVFAVVLAKQGRMATVTGEPGIGKTRLLAEFRAHVEHNEPKARWIEGHSLSYGQTLPYHLVVDVVRSMLGVSASADEPELRAALERSLRDLLGDAWADAYAYLGHLLSVRLEPDVQARISTLERETVKRYAASLLQVLRALSARGPVVLVCEDVHWADAATVDALFQVIPLVNEIPLLCLVTSRIERDAPGWRLIASARDLFGDALTDLRLDPLSSDDSRALVANLLAIESLVPTTRDLILAKAEGNPFFVEEVVRMLIDRGAVVRERDRWIATSDVVDVEIPDTLQGLLLARIDQLSSESRRTLRVASVIGRQFGVTILERLLEAPLSV